MTSGICFITLYLPKTESSSEPRARLAAGNPRKPPFLVFPKLWGHRCVGDHAELFLWVLKIQIQSFMLVQPVLIGTESSPPLPFTFKMQKSFPKPGIP